jgi:hypothetical protein
MHRAGASVRCECAERDCDQVDAQLIANVAATLRYWQKDKRRSPATKVLGDAVWFFWQNPRFRAPVGG